MPFYEYRCTACEHEFEALQKMSDEPLTDCPACQKDSLTKLISAAGFQLKGGGWYVTDFKDKPKKAEKTSEDKKTKTTKKTKTKAKS
jgi:putative FmdB family regulatory protein